MTVKKRSWPKYYKLFEEKKLPEIKYNEVRKYLEVPCSDIFHIQKFAEAKFLEVVDTNVNEEGDECQCWPVAYDFRTLGLAEEISESVSPLKNSLKVHAVVDALVFKFKIGQTVTAVVRQVCKKAYKVLISDVYHATVALGKNDTTSNADVKVNDEIRFILTEIGKTEFKGLYKIPDERRIHDPVSSTEEEMKEESKPKKSPSTPKKSQPSTKKVTRPQNDTRDGIYTNVDKAIETVVHLLHSADIKTEKTANHKSKIVFSPKYEAQQQIDMSAVSNHEIVLSSQSQKSEDEFKVKKKKKKKKAVMNESEQHETSSVEEWVKSAKKVNGEENKITTKDLGLKSENEIKEIKSDKKKKKKHKKESDVTLSLNCTEPVNGTKTDHSIEEITQESTVPNGITEKGTKKKKKKKKSSHHDESQNDVTVISTADSAIDESSQEPLKHKKKKKHKLKDATVENGTDENLNLTLSTSQASDQTSKKKKKKKRKLENLSQTEESVIPQDTSQTESPKKKKKKKNKE